MFIFFIICFKATKYVRENIGFFAAVIFVLGLMSFMGNSDNRDSSKIAKKELSDRNIKDFQQSYVEIVLLENNLISKINLFIIFGKDPETGEIIPLTANSHVSGLILGTQWDPTSIDVYPAPGKDKFEYTVIGYEKWKFPGFTVFNQSKEFRGIVEVNEGK